MNHIYRTLWSDAAQAFIAVPEFAAAKGKASKSSKARGALSGAWASLGGAAALAVGAFALNILSLSVALAAAPPVLPTGESLQSGAATVARPTTNNMTINQTSNRAIINWASFSIGNGASVAITQPNAQSILLNRVTGAGSSNISGGLTANGQVFLINPNGVLFGSGASVNVGGLVASTMDISNSNFNADTYNFARGTGSSTTSSVRNEAVINAASGGYIVLLGNSVINAGEGSARLNAPNGSIFLGAGSEASMVVDASGKLTSASITKAADNAFVSNGSNSQINANGGSVTLHAVATRADSVGVAINNSGLISAQSVAEVGGVIQLRAEGGVVYLGPPHQYAPSSLLDASKQSGATGTGKVIISTTDRVLATRYVGQGPQIIADVLTVDAVHGIGGNQFVAEQYSEYNFDAGQYFEISKQATALTTAVSQARLSNTGSNGVYVMNYGDITVAARNTNGNVEIRTADGLQAAYGTRYGSQNANGGSITVGTVDGISGIKTLLNADADSEIRLSTGNGASGQNFFNTTTGQAGGTGGHGGSITVNESILAAGSVRLETGSGGGGGYGAYGGATGRGGDGGMGGNGGSIEVNATINADKIITMLAGGMGSGGYGAGMNWQDTTPTTTGGNGGAAGASGSITISAAVESTGSSVELDVGGYGGYGGSGGMGYLAASGNGGAGGTGGNVTVNTTGSIKALQGYEGSPAVYIRAGNGTQGGNGGHAFEGGSYGQSGKGGQGGSVQINGKVQGTEGRVSVQSGYGGSGYQGYDGSYSSDASQILEATSGSSGGNAGHITIAAAITSGQNIEIQAGSGGAGGSGGFSSLNQTTNTYGPGGKGGSGGAGGNVTVTSTGSLDAGIYNGDSISILSGSGGDGGASGSSDYWGNLGNPSNGQGGSGGSGGNVLLNGSLSALGSIAVESGPGGGGGGYSRYGYGGYGGYGASGGHGGDSGSITINAAITAAGRSANTELDQSAIVGHVNISTGINGAGGRGAEGQFSEIESLRNGGNGGNAGHGGSITVNAPITSYGDTYLSTDYMYESGGSGGAGEYGSNSYNSFAWSGGSGGSGGNGGNAGGITINPAGSIIARSIELGDSDIIKGIITLRTGSGSNAGSGGRGGTSASIGEGNYRAAGGNSGNGGNGGNGGALVINGNLTSAGDIYISAGRGESGAWGGSLGFGAPNGTSGSAGMSGTQVDIQAQGKVHADGVFSLENGTWRQIGADMPGSEITGTAAGVLPDFYAKDFRFNSDANFIRAQSGDGSAEAPYVIKDVYGLQGVASPLMLDQNVQLGGNIDAAGTQFWNGTSSKKKRDIELGGEGASSPRGFRPIGTNSRRECDGQCEITITSFEGFGGPGSYGGGAFTGTFDGKGYAINGLMINRPQETNVGLFGYVSVMPSEDLGRFTVFSSAPVLAPGTIQNVTLNDANVTGGSNVGALVGTAERATIDKVFVNNATVRGSNQQTQIVGTREVIVNNPETGDFWYSYYENIYGPLSSSNIGGLAGQITNGTSLTRSYSTGQVINQDTREGAEGSRNTGGLVGALGEGSSISEAFSFSSVQGQYNVGGLVGSVDGYLSNVYATGAGAGGDSPSGVSGIGDVGGLIGYFQDGRIENAYSTARVSSEASAGALIGAAEGAQLNNSYWDATSSGVGQALGAGSLTGTPTEITANQNSASTYSGFDISGAAGSSVWRIYEGNTRPLLRTFMTAGTVDNGTGTRVYDGTPTELGATQPAVIADSTPVDAVINPLSSVSARNVGSYSVGVWSTQLGYDLTGSISLDITKRDVHVSGLSANGRQYDGTTNATVNTGNALVNNVASGDTLNFSGNGGTFSNANAGSRSVASTGNLVAGDGTLLSNYNFTGTNAMNATITPRDVTVSGLVANGRQYDGTNMATVNTSNAVVNNVVSGQSLGYSGSTGTFTGTNVGTYAVSSMGSLTAGEGTNLNNYNLTGVNAMSASITPRDVTVSGLTANGRVYDGTMAAVVNTNAAVVNNVVNGQSLSFSGNNGSFTSANAGVRNVTAHGSLVAGNNNTQLSNYNLAGTNVFSATISQRPVNITGMTALDRPFDTTNIIVISGTPVLNNVVAGQSLGLSGTPVGTTASPDVTPEPVPVTVSGWTLANGTGNNAGLASNYSLTPLILSAKINPASDQGVGAQVGPLINRLRNANPDAPTATTGGTFAGSGVPNCVFTPDMNWICIVQPGINLP